MADAMRYGYSRICCRQDDDDDDDNDDDDDDDDDDVNDDVNQDAILCDKCFSCRWCRVRRLVSERLPGFSLLIPTIPIIITEKMLIPIIPIIITEKMLIPIILRR